MPGPLAPQTPPAGTEPVGAEKRAEPRYACPRLVRARRVTVPESAFRLSIVENVSTHGIGLIFTDAVAPDTLLEIEMHGASVVKRFARVVHSTKQADGWLVGCALKNSLNDGELEGLLN